MIPSTGGSSIRVSRVASRRALPVWAWTVHGGVGGWWCVRAVRPCSRVRGDQGLFPLSEIRGLLFSATVGGHPIDAKTDAMDAGGQVGDFSALELVGPLASRCSTSREPWVSGLSHEDASSHGDKVDGRRSCLSDVPLVIRQGLHNLPSQPRKISLFTTDKQNRMGLSSAL